MWHVQFSSKLASWPTTFSTIKATLNGDRLRKVLSHMASCATLAPSAPFVPGGVLRIGKKSWQGGALNKKITASLGRVHQLWVLGRCDLYCGRVKLPGP